MKKRLLFCFVLIPCWACEGDQLVAVRASKPIPYPPGNYYVAVTGSDSNSGAQARPWRHLAVAASRVGVGSTVHVAPGDYSESLITVSNSGAEGQPITFVSDQPLAAKVISGSTYVWTLAGSYITIKGFEVTPVNLNTQHGSIQSFGSHESILDNFVHGVCQRDGASAIYAVTNSYITVARNKVAGAGRTCSTVHGITVGGSNNSIVNNTVWNQSGNGILGFPWFHDSQIMNNDVDHGGGTLAGFPPQDGIRLWNDGSGITDGVTVGNNIVRDCIGYGFGETGPIGANVQYLNNDSLNNGQGDYSIGSTIPQGPLSVDPRYVTYSPEGGGDYHLQAGSPMVDAGTATGAPNTDFEGQPRPQGAGYDVGADEAA
jgi:hypothetical protein